MIDLSYENRFGGLTRIFGPGALTLLRSSHVMVVGIGGVGTWAVESLARSGVGHLSLVDLDDICATNTNRQIPAMDPEWGRLKVEVMAERVRKINPEAVVSVFPDFFTQKSALTLLKNKPTLVVDAIDIVPDKVTLIEVCTNLGIPVVVSGGVGGKTDPTRVRVADLGRERGDMLLKAVKKGLKDRGLGPDENGLWGVETVYSEEPSVRPWDVCDAVPRPDAGGSARIDCAVGFGAVSFTTGAFGFALASRAVHRLLRN